MKKKIIIDTDCGSDDAVAIVMALQDRRYHVEMFTTVAGNVPVDQATVNTLISIEYAGTYEPPVYEGASRMLFKELVFAYETHGNDGMGDIGLKVDRLSASDGNAVLELMKKLKEGGDEEYDIIALGPLTNIAIAILLDVDIVRKAGRIVIMGSAGLGAGNVTPTAEFNVWQDAEAAKIVVDSGLENIIFVGWDACLGDDIFNEEEIQKIRNSGPLGKFSIDINEQLIALNKDRFGYESIDFADPAAMAAALYPECIDVCDKYYCDIDVSNGIGYGTLVVDRDNVLNKEPNVYICSKLKADLYKEYIYTCLTTGVD